MGFEKIRSIRPLTTLMLKLLQDCYYRDKHDLDPPVFYDTQLIKGLIERGLIKDWQTPADKRQYAVTELGKEYIKHYFGN